MVHGVGGLKEKKMGGGRRAVIIWRLYFPAAHLPPPLAPGCAHHSAANAVSGGISTKTAAFLGEIREAYAGAGFFNMFALIGVQYSLGRPYLGVPQKMIGCGAEGSKTY